MATTNAKVTRRTSSKKMYSHDVIIGDETVTVKTACKLFGGIMLEDGKIAGDCLKCKESKGIQSLCAIATYPKILDEKKDKNGSSGTRKIVARNGKMTIKEFVGNCINSGEYTRKEIIDLFCIEYPENNQSQGGRYVSSAFNAKYSIKRWGKIAVKQENGKIAWS